MCVCVCVCACGIEGAREIGGGRVSLILVSDNILHQESSDPNEKKERKKESVHFTFPDNCYFRRESKSEIIGRAGRVAQFIGRPEN